MRSRCAPLGPARLSGPEGDQTNEQCVLAGASPILLSHRYYAENLGLSYALGKGNRLLHAVVVTEKCRAKVPSAGLPEGEFTMTSMAWANRRSGYAVPRRTAPSTQIRTTVLCETRDVRVIANGLKRFLQFRGSGVAGTTPWRNNEAIVTCQQRTDTCAISSHAVASATACAACPCNPIPRPDWSTHGFGYVERMFQSVTSHDPRCARSQTSLPRFRLLQIGLGGGTFPGAVRYQCPGAVVDVIEKQEDVVGLTSKFFGFDRGEGRLVVSDGLMGLRELDGRHRYDAVVVDCMIQGVTPPGCKSLEFVRLIAKNLRRGGHVAQWAWGADRELLRQHYSKFFANFTDMRYGGIGGVLHISALQPQPAGGWEL